ncbi:MAG: hypothetical protein RR565_03670 [Erysipelothrix sp.]
MKNKAHFSIKSLVIIAFSTVVLSSIDIYSLLSENVAIRNIIPQYPTISFVTILREIIINFVFVAFIVLIITYIKSNNPK